MEWYQRFQRPVVITEYGADTVAGLHAVHALYATTDHTRSDRASPLCSHSDGGGAAVVSGG